LVSNLMLTKYKEVIGKHKNDLNKQIVEGREFDVNITVSDNSLVSLSFHSLAVLTIGEGDDTIGK